MIEDANLHREMGQTNEARLKLDEALVAGSAGHRVSSANAVSPGRLAAVSPAKKLVDENKFDDAIVLLDQILAADPENRAALYYRIIALEREASSRDTRIRDLDVPGAARPRTGRDRLAKRFDEIRLERFVVPPGTELCEAVRLLDQGGQSSSSEPPRQLSCFDIL